MDFSNLEADFSSLVAAAADLCIKPWKHAVIIQNSDTNELVFSDDCLELLLKIECRDLDGERYPLNDLELEIFRSGTDLNLMFSWCNQIERPILWHGKHSVWMNGDNGQRCKAPPYGCELESFARRVSALVEKK